MRNVFLLVMGFGFTLASGEAFAKLKILTTTTTLRSVVQSVGGSFVEVESFTQGPQDPHFVEAKPSYMSKARNADLVVAMGLELEVGWLPNILSGSGNPKIQAGQ